MTDPRPLLSCQGVSLQYRTSTGSVDALRDISFDAHAHELLTIVGPSGCGKTTLLKIIAGLLEPTGGHVHFAAPPPTDRPRAALIFQEHALLPWLTVRKNVELALEMRDLPELQSRQRVEQFIGQVGLEDFMDSYPHQLSVGMRQRVSLARAFLTGSPLLLMDEPFASLDAQTHRILHEDLLSLWRQDRNLILYVTHDIEEAILTGDRVLVLTGRPGHVVKTLPVPIPRPQRGSIESRELIESLTEEIWDSLESDIRVGLRMRSSGQSVPR